MDHYTRLQVSRSAEPEVIEKAYKALCMKYHPDKVPPEGRHAATRRMQRINEAYEVLSDPRRRAGYDASLPPEHAAGTAWEQFLEKGLVGMFWDWARRRV
ncbi:MAG: J domain-containing protein [Coriobacteriia bacterium]|nr:J domain-containing protein [Coriobacteriia bacterium]